MRKLKRRGNSNAKLMIIFFLTLFFISVGYSWLHEELSIVGKGNIIVQNQDDGSLSFTYTKDNWYSNGYFYYNYNVTLTNNTDSEVNGWTIEIDIPDDVESVTCWSSICSVSNGILTVTNETYNANIAVGSSINFGIHFWTKTENLELTDVVINGNEIDSGETGGGETGGGETGGGETGGGETGGGETGGGETGDDDDDNITSDEGMEATLNLKTAWANNDGTYIAQYELLITNNTDSDINSWECILNSDIEIEVVNLWNANYINQGTTIIVTNLENIGTIGVGESIQVVFQISSTVENYNLTISSINK